VYERMGPVFLLSNGESEVFKKSYVALTNASPHRHSVGNRNICFFVSNRRPWVAWEVLKVSAIGDWRIRGFCLIALQIYFGALQIRWGRGNQGNLNNFSPTLQIFLAIR